MILLNEDRDVESYSDIEAIDVRPGADREILLFIYDEAPSEGENLRDIQPLIVGGLDWRRSWLFICAVAEALGECRCHRLGKEVRHESENR